LALVIRPRSSVTVEAAFLRKVSAYTLRSQPRTQLFSKRIEVMYNAPTNRAVLARRANQQRASGMPTGIGANNNRGPDMFNKTLSRTSSLCVCVAVGLLVSGAASSQTTVTYVYDALGRVTFVYDPVNGNRDYDYDAAGNRRLVSVGAASDAATDPSTAAPSMPTFIANPTGTADIDGNYNVSWGAAAGTITSYELWEANNSGFTGETRIYTGMSTTAGFNVTGRANGTYYYRARACNGAVCGSHRTGVAGTSVLLIPPQPGTMSVPTLVIPGNSYQITWGASSGPITQYKLEQHSNSAFTALVQSWTPLSSPQQITASTAGTFYFRVAACNASGCSAFRPGPNALQVLAPPATPTGLSMTLASFCTWSAGWTAVSGATSYNVTDNHNGVRNVTSPAVSIVWANPCPPPSGSTAGPDDLKPAFVQACNAAGCSANASFDPNATPPPGAPSSISYPLSSSTGSFTVSWGNSPTVVATYEAYQSTSPTFSSVTSVYSGGGNSVALTRGDGTYYYRVRACNGANCSAYATGNGITVTLPAGIPGAMVIPSSGTMNTNYTISWGGATGTIANYQVEQHSNSSFTALVSTWNPASTSLSVPAPAQGTFYFRVRACNVSGCSAFKNGPNAITIIGPPGVPTNLSTTLASFCTWTASWSAVSGATSYTVTDASNQVRTTSTNAISYVWSSPCPPPPGGSPTPKKPKWVQACNSAGCSANATFP
jgi:hypothetical protein